MSAYLSVDVEFCRYHGHKLQTAWSDKTPMKVNLICRTCTDANPGKTAYVAYGVDTQSFGLWRPRRVLAVKDEYTADPDAQ